MQSLYGLSAANYATEGVKKRFTLLNTCILRQLYSHYSPPPFTPPLTKAFNRATYSNSRLVSYNILLAGYISPLLPTYPGAEGAGALAEDEDVGRPDLLLDLRLQVRHATFAVRKILFLRNLIFLALALRVCRFFFYRSSSQITATTRRHVFLGPLRLYDNANGPMTYIEHVCADQSDSSRHFAGKFQLACISEWWISVYYTANDVCTGGDGEGRRLHWLRASG